MTTVHRLSRIAAAIVAFALLVHAVQLLLYWGASPPLDDADAYWQAAIRLREGRPLYPEWPDDSAPEVYRYAPWFAIIWIPLTLFPQSVVYGAWYLVLIGASLSVLVPLVRDGVTGWITLAVLAFFFADGALSGNVQNFMVAGLVFGLRSRWGPLVIALASSLKAAPLAFALVYAGRREWGKLSVTVGLTAILIAPVLLFDVSEYPIGPISSTLGLSTVAPWAWIGLALISATVALRLSHTRHAWLAAAAAAFFAAPQAHWHYPTIFSAGLASPPADSVPPQPGSRSADADSTVIPT